jgi:class 3 adenylate cyclase
MSGDEYHGVERRSHPRVDLESFYLFLDEDHSRRRDQRVGRIIKIISLVGGASALAWSAVFLASGLTWIIAVESMIAVMLIGIYFLVRAGHLPFAKHLFMITSLAYVTCMVIFFEGPSTIATPVNHLWFLVLIFGVNFFLFDTRPLWRYCYYVVAILGFVAGHMGWMQVASSVNVPDAMKIWVNPIFLFFLGVFSIYISRLYLDDILRTEEKLDAANSRLETLLENMLPKPIAERLRRQGKTFADGYKNCGVLFADLVGFTKLSEERPPNEVVALLNRIFSCFDDLVQKYGLEKIKTIGDAYMVSGGLLKEDPDHLEKLACLALDMQNEMKMLKLLPLRVGINSGVVTAGVIGKRRFIYDLWGDTVNVAARMESHGLPGHIHVTECVYTALREHFVFESRGTVPIKGKGEMPTYFLLRRK